MPNSVWSRWLPTKRKFGVPCCCWLVVLVSINTGGRIMSQTTPSHVESTPPLYRVFFESGEPIASTTLSFSLASSPACTDDGTVLMMAVSRSLPGASTQSAIADATHPPVETLITVSTAGEVHDFRLDQVSDLYDVQQKGYYAANSGVTELVIAAVENKRTKEMFVASDGTKHEVTTNPSDHHDYLLVFDARGEYRSRIQIDDTLAIVRVGLFPSGSLLALGFDRQDRSPKLVMLKEDGTLFRLLDIPKGDAPPKIFDRKNESDAALYIKPTQLVPYRNSIVVVQNDSAFPLIEVSESGEARVIQPKLPGGERIGRLIPSDGNLYAESNSGSEAHIYEISADDGAVLRRIEPGRDDVACIHDGKFLAFNQSAGKLVPLVGTLEPAATGTNQKR